MLKILTSTIPALWIVAIALLSVQNASLVSLKFLMWRSIDLPWGLVLAGGVGIGFAIGGYLPLLVSKAELSKRK
jgi:lipopolysaccharide assembly protein A